jgi:predicted MFS family arabinose efflux permease
VLTTAVGFSFHSIATYASGLFIEPLEQEFGWSRSEISIGLAIAAMATVPFSPVMGAFIDRWGSRRIALPGLVLTACSLAAFGTVGDSIAHWIALWCVYAFIGLSVKSTVWTHAISSTFHAGRGLALAVMLSGTALAQALVPPAARWLIADFGWREAWFWLGFAWCLPALLLAFFFLKDQRVEAPSAATSQELATTDSRMTVGQAFRNPSLLKLALATFIMMTLGLAVIVHLVPVLSERGLTRETAAWVAGLSGIAGIAGKLITGALMDRFDGATIGAITLASAGLGFALLVLPSGSAGTLGSDGHWLRCRYQAASHSLPHQSPHQYAQLWQDLWPDEQRHGPKRRAGAAARWCNLRYKWLLRVPACRRRTWERARRSPNLELEEDDRSQVSIAIIFYAAGWSLSGE